MLSFHDTARRCSLACAAVAVLAMMVHGIAGSADASEFVLTRNGQPAATIVVAAAPTRSAVAAAIELRDHIQKISGAKLPIVADTATVSGTRILVGPSAATKALGLKDDFTPQEYMISVRNGALVLMGRDGSTPKPAPVQDFNQLKIAPNLIPDLANSAIEFEDEHGSCFAVYDFLQRDCGVRWYGPPTWAWSTRRSPR